MSETAAVLLLATYAVVTVGVIAYRVSRYDVDATAWMLYCVERFFVGLMWRWRSNRPCPLPSDGAALVIANHVSAADPMQLWMNHHLGSGRYNVRTISFMMAREYYVLKGLHWICKSMRSIPVSRDGKDTGPLRDALRKLKRGHIVGVFPEGQINLTGSGVLDGNLGVAWLALKSRVPVYPAFMADVPGGADMIAPFFTRSHVRVTYGDPIDLTDYYALKPKGEVLEQVTELMMQRLADLGGVHRVRASDNAETTDDNGIIQREPSVAAPVAVSAVVAPQATGT
tara:strand:+ start:1632 stop:2483 length:852 start_codon:yes stop_codon:yes gene_type:complete